MGVTVFEGKSLTNGITIGIGEGNTSGWVVTAIFIPIIIGINKTITNNQKTTINRLYANAS